MTVGASWCPGSSNTSCPGHPTDDSLVPIRADLSEISDVRDVVKKAVAEHAAPLRAVVNLVGGFAMTGRVAETSPEEFDRLLGLNLRPLCHLTHAAVPELIASGGGAIVGVSAKAALSPFPGAAAYITSKAAVAAFLGALATEYKSEGIRVNTVLPSVIDTAANRERQPAADRSGWVDPVQIAETISFLVAESSSAVNGAQIPVAGLG